MENNQVRSSPKRLAKWAVSKIMRFPSVRKIWEYRKSRPARWFAISCHGCKAQTQRDEVAILAEEVEILSEDACKAQKQRDEVAILAEEVEILSEDAHEGAEQVSNDGVLVIMHDNFKLLAEAW